MNGDEVIYIELGETSFDFCCFAYCCNDPIGMSDDMGTLPKWIKKQLQPLKGLFSAYLFNVLLCMQTKINGSFGHITTVVRAIYNYKKNSAKERKKPIIDYIDDQFNYKEWYLGWQSLEECGCELIAVYNIMRALNKTCPLSVLALQFELSGYVMLYGFFGSSPTRLWHFFTSTKLKYGMTYNLDVFKKKLKELKFGIGSCWNKPISNGLHTFMIKCTNGKLYEGINGYAGDPKKDPDERTKSAYSLSDIMYTDRFIVGYWFK